MKYLIHKHEDRSSALWNPYLVVLVLGADSRSLELIRHPVLAILSTELTTSKTLCHSKPFLLRTQSTCFSYFHISRVFFNQMAKDEHFVWQRSNEQKLEMVKVKFIYNVVIRGQKQGTVASHLALLSE